MSVVYHGGQYEKTTGIGPRSQSWHLRKKSQRPRAQTGYTMFISNDRGHILDHNKKSPFYPHHSYAGTWDLPCKIPANIGSFTSYSEGKVRQLIEEKIDWTNDLKRVWIRLDPKYKRLIQHFRSTPGSKATIQLPLKFQYLGLEDLWEQPDGICQERSVCPQQTIPDNFLKKKSVIVPKPPISNKTHCFHWQGFSHPKELCCDGFKDTWQKPFPLCLAKVGCEREYEC